MKSSASVGTPDSATAVRSLHILPVLPYGYAALEPHVDARTLRVHHDGHHAGYVQKLNELLVTCPGIRSRTAQWLLLHPAEIPRPIRTAVMNNAGGHVNHCLYWQSMCAPGGHGLSGELAHAINARFGSFEGFQKQFEDAAMQHFGSGWVWLIVDRQAQSPAHQLRIVTTPGHGNPLQQGLFPLLVNDVWEHAYYLKYENRKQEYLHSWWSVTNWSNAKDRYADSGRSAPSPSDDNLGTMRQAR